MLDVVFKATSVKTNSVSINVFQAHFEVVH